MSELLPRAVSPPNPNIRFHSQGRVTDCEVRDDPQLEGLVINALCCVLLSAPRGSLKKGSELALRDRQRIRETLRRSLLLHHFSKTVDDSGRRTQTDHDSQTASKSLRLSSCDHNWHAVNLLANRA